MTPRKPVSPLTEFFRNASAERKHDVYTRVIAEAIKSQLEVLAEAKKITDSKLQPGSDT